MADGDRPAASSPSSTGSASRKSPVDSPCRYKSGSTASTFGDRRVYGGRMRLVKRCRLPSTTRLSFTRGAFSANVPVPVVTGRGLADPVAHDQRAPLAVAILGEARD